MPVVSYWSKESIQKKTSVTTVNDVKLVKLRLAHILVQTFEMIFVYFRGLLFFKLTILVMYICFIFEINEMLLYYYTNTLLITFDKKFPYFF